MADTQLTQVVPSTPSVADVPEAAEPPRIAWRTTGLSPRTLVQGFVGSVLIMLGSLGAGGTLISDPILGSSPLSWIRYGHGQQLAQAVLYIGVGLLVWAWVRLGRDVLARAVAARGVLIAGIAWVAPMIIAPPTFTRDVFSYLGQGALALRGFDPYSVGPNVLGDAIAQNVHPFWQSTPAPYGPLFILVAKGVAAVIGEHLILGVILMRLALMIGLVLLIFALPGLTRHLGGRLSVALWLMVANPMTVIHLVGGPHNDLLMVGLLAMGTLLVLEKRHVSGIALVTLAAAVKATAAVALPFLVWVWAGRLEGTFLRRFVRAGAAGIGVFVVVFGACSAVAKVNLGWIGALHAPTLIVNWVNLPTGLGEILHAIVNIFGSLPEQPFDTLTRFLGVVLLVAFGLVQWWRSREGGADAVRRMGITLLAVAILAPPTLPWYLTWGLAIFGATPWKRSWLAFSAGLAVLILLVYYPNGEGAMGDFWHMVCVLLAAVLTGWSMLKVDPLGLRGHPKPVSATGTGTAAAVPVPVAMTNGAVNGTAINGSAVAVSVPATGDEPEEPAEESDAAAI